MQRLTTVVVSVLAIAISTSAHAGAAAEQASFLAVRGGKFALAKQPKEFNRECVENIPDSLLVPIVQAMLDKTLSTSELRKLDVFFGSPLGLRYNQDIASRNSHIPGYIPASFTPAEQALIGGNLMSPAGDKYFAAISSDNTVAAARTLLQEQAARCKAAP